ncbi:MAG: NAD(P)-dependent oxidoreductase [Alphaproteobacteria bacterium]|nr:NAD(P)-dependent oxidoreductase [Alphaproteobacteria bacterium]
MSDGERVLLTGGAGYIGCILVPALLEAGYDVTVLDRFPHADPGLAACCRYSTFHAVRGDVRDLGLLRRLVAKADIVLPLAALVGAPLCARSPNEAVAVNRDAVRALLSLLSREQRLVFPTTNSGYGSGLAAEYCTEESPLRPVSLYGTSKVEAEAAVLERGDGVSLRLATVFGMSPRMRLDLLVNDFTHRAVTDRTVVLFEGHFKRNYIHVRDIAAAFLHTLANYGAMSGRAYNVGLSDANLSKLELCAKIKEQVPDFVYLEAPIGEDPDRRNYIVSNERIERTGWRPNWTLERGIAELVKGFEMLNNARFGNVA